MFYLELILRNGFPINLIKKQKTKTSKQKKIVESYKANLMGFKPTELKLC